MEQIRLDAVDLWIVGAYLVGVTVMGIALAKRATQGLHDYFLGARKIPWWLLGISGSGSNFDLTGTMIAASFFFALGFQGFWVESRGSLVLSLCVLLAFMGRWLRRSKVMTSAEWMELRFGTGRGGQAARVLAASANIFVTIGMIVYFAKGIGKFVHTFVPAISPDVCSLITVGICLAYTVSSGLYGVIYTDFLQLLMMVAAAGYLTIKAAFLPDHAAVIAAAGPAWSSLAPQWTAEPMTWLDNPAVYQMFGICLFFWVSKSLLEGLGGMSGGYMAQRFYAARDERSAGLLTLVWALFLCFRWTMVAGVALLGLWIAQTDATVASQLHVDPERALPIVISQVLPLGLKGIAVAGLLAAAMSTFDAELNAGASYWVRDIYQRFIRRDATERQLVRQSQLATLGIALIGVALAFSISNINEIWDFLTGPLAVALLLPLALRWYWWRFNGEAFAASTGVGMIAAIVIKLGAPGLPFYASTSLALVASLGTALVVTYMTAPVAKETLQTFYRQIRPFGAWRPLLEELTPEERIAQKCQGRRDIANTAVALLWQISLFLAGISAVWHKWTAALGFTTVAIALSVVLYFHWYRLLPAHGAAHSDD